MWSMESGLHGGGADWRNKNVALRTAHWARADLGWAMTRFDRLGLDGGWIGRVGLV